jgi:transcriptional regulator with XRE-family HTH domain
MDEPKAKKTSAATKAAAGASVASATLEASTPAINAEIAPEAAQARKRGRPPGKAAPKAEQGADGDAQGEPAPKKRGRRSLERAAKDATLQVRGAALARALDARAQSLGLSQRAAAHRVGFSEPYYALLMGGSRWFGAVEDQALKRIAEFLDVPMISVLLMSERISPEDFFRQTTLESQIDFVFSTMSTDKRWTSAMPRNADWKNTPLSVRLLAALLYQECSGKDLMEKARLLRVESPVADLTAP